MTANTSLAKGRDPRYLTEGAGTGHAGGTRYYSEAAGEPPGQWLGAGAPVLDLEGDVDADQLQALYMDRVAPDGQRLDARARPHFRPVREREEAAVAVHLVAHPYATAGELEEVRAAERAKSQSAVPYFDFTVSAAKSVSVLHASLLTAARRLREGGADEDARELEDQARAITDALLSSARAAVARVERALFVRTGPQGTEYRDAAGSVTAVFLQHTSREGDPQLHVHIAVMNLAQRGDQADARWRTLHGAMLYQERLAVAAYAARELATRLTDLGYVLVPREDGNGFEIGGVDQAVMDAFSSRRAQITPEVARMAEEYRQRYGREPSRRTLWAMAQAATLETRKAKSRGRSDRSGQPDRTAGDELDEWEARTTERELGTLSGVHEAVRSFARPEGLDAPAELDASSGRALSGERSPRPSATPRRLPARPCCGRSTWPCRPWRQGWTRRPWPRSWRTRRWPLLRSWRWDRRRTWWTCPRWARGPVTAGPCSRTQGPSGTPPRASWTWRSGYWPRRAARSPSSPRRTRRTWPWRARASARTRPRWRPGSSRRGPPCPCWWPQRARARHTSWPRTRGPGRRITGGRVVGVTLSTNAAKVMAAEGLAEAYNVAQALGRREDGSTGRQLELGTRDVMVIDEASQVSTRGPGRPGGPRAADRRTPGPGRGHGPARRGGGGRHDAPDWLRPRALGAGRGAPL